MRQRHGEQPLQEKAFHTRLQCRGVPCRVQCGGEGADKINNIRHPKGRVDKRQEAGRPHCIVVKGGPKSNADVKRETQTAESKRQHQKTPKTERRKQAYNIVGNVCMLYIALKSNECPTANLQTGVEPRRRSKVAAIEYIASLASLPEGRRTVTQTAEVRQEGTE